MPRKSWWARLPFGVRMVAGTSALLIAIGGGVAAVAALTHDNAKPRIVTAVGDAGGDAAGDSVGDWADDSATPGATASEGLLPVLPPIGSVAAPARTSAEADRSGSRNPARAPVPLAARPPAKAQPSLVLPAASPPAGQVVTTRTEVETREIPYASRTVRDPDLPSGSKQVQTPGVAGEKTLRYLVTVINGKPAGRRLLDSTVTRQPQPEVVALGVQDPSGQNGCPLDFCVPIGRDGTCWHHRRDENDDVNVAGNDVTLLSGGSQSVAQNPGAAPAGGWYGGGSGGDRGKCR